MQMESIFTSPYLDGSNFSITNSCCFQLSPPAISSIFSESEVTQLVSRQEGILWQNMALYNSSFRSMSPRLQMSSRCLLNSLKNKITHFQYLLFFKTIAIKTNTLFFFRLKLTLSYSILVTLSHSAVMTANILNVTCEASSICSTYKKKSVKNLVTIYCKVIDTFLIVYLQIIH